MTLADLWPTLGVDERLSILIEQQTVELRRLAAALPETHSCARSRVAGYANAIADVRCYVIEGDLLPPEEV